MYWKTFFSMAWVGRPPSSLAANWPFKMSIEYCSCSLLVMRWLYLMSGWAELQLAGHSVLGLPKSPSSCGCCPSGERPLLLPSAPAIQRWGSSLPLNMQDAEFCDKQSFLHLYIIIMKNGICMALVTTQRGWILSLLYKAELRLNGASESVLFEMLGAESLCLPCGVGRTAVAEWVTVGHRAVSADSLATSQCYTAYPQLLWQWYQGGLSPLSPALEIWKHTRRVWIGCYSGRALHWGKVEFIWSNHCESHGKGGRQAAWGTGPGYSVLLLKDMCQAQFRARAGAF